MPPAAPGAAATALAVLPPAATGLRDAAAEASLFLLVGGLVMLMLIVVLVILQNMVPERGRSQQPGGRPTIRQLRALDGGPLAHASAAARRGGRRRMRSLAPVDLCLDRVVELRVGEPRLLQSLPGHSRIRLYGCRGCAFTLGAAGGGCAQERAALEEVFGAVYGGNVRASETTCRRRGDPTCEFEVAH